VVVRGCVGCGEKGREERRGKDGWFAYGRGVGNLLIHDFYMMSYNVGAEQGRHIS
jgi:hypothetical protein